MRTTSTVLIVDDSATMRSVLRDMLRQLGFRTIDEAENGREALAKLQTHIYSVVLSDWHMESMDGIELLRETRRLRPPFGRVPFVLLATESNWGRQTTARLDGADGFLPKPFRIETLKAKIDVVLARGEGRSYQRA